MRVGSNPNRGKPAMKFKRVVLTVATHLPNEDGYHKDRFEIVQTCLRSMTRHCETEYTLIIWDNNSIPKLQEWMRDELKPDILIRSENIGKNTARTCMTRMLPNNAIVTFSDDDMLYYPNWLKPQIELLEHFPKVACVTGYPVRTAFRWGIENTLRWAKQNGEIEAGKFLSEKWEREFAQSVGRDWEMHKNSTADDLDYRVTWQGKTAYLTAHHCQFVAYAGVAGTAMQYDAMAMGDERPFDTAMDKLGLRLATTQRLSRHIGNVIHDELREEIKRMELC